MTKAEAERMAKSVIHWALIRQRERFREIDKAKMDEDGHVSMQALHCPYYVKLNGTWGADWGCIMHPHSEKFGQLVFEHEWCGCHYHESGHTDGILEDWGRA